MARHISPKMRPYIRAAKLTKGKPKACCDRGAIMRAVKHGATPEAAVAEHCGASCPAGTAGAARRERKRRR